MIAKLSIKEITETINPTDAGAVLSSPLEVFLLLLFIVCGLIWLSETKAFSKIFNRLPLVIWVVLVPAMLTGFNILPTGLSLYLNIGKICLPLSLFYLIVSCDLRGITKLGKPAIIAALAGTLGVSLGGTLVVSLFARGENADLWQGFAVISAGWIGGTANGVAVQQGLQAPADIIAPLLLMQTLVGFLWLMILLFFAQHQKRIARILGHEYVHAHNISATKASTKSQKFSLQALAGLLAIGFLALLISGALGQALPEFGSPTIISSSTWVILTISTLAIVISTSPKVKIQTEQASNFGYLFLYMMLASLGTQLDFSAFNQTGVYVVAGALWLLIHISTLLIIGKIFKLPPAMIALGSMANIGGIVTTPLVASYYDKKLVPLALLMAIGTQIIGIYLPFLLASLFSNIALS
ncbi:MAG: hypothetical protein COA43_14455 [Robiginitomaculum sp.]|nr:MAG: hypothetical protein COA43_14455 [Robiginitomaculum sp.]